MEKKNEENDCLEKINFLLRLLGFDDKRRRDGVAVKKETTFGRKKRSDIVAIARDFADGQSLQVSSVAWIQGFIRLYGRF